MKEEGYSWLTLKTLAMNRNDYGSRLYSETKVCPQCGKTKLLAQFGADSRSESGLDRYCKDCHNKYVKKSIGTMEVKHVIIRVVNMIFRKRTILKNLLKKIYDQN